MYKSREGIDEHPKAFNNRVLVCNIEKGTEVIGRQIQGVAKIVRLWLSDTNRCYVDCEQKDGNIISTPLDMTIKY
tara:strand:- start:2361 stop:2585 length:225 start_codon:yes stop_codon:yes gene_type:complete